MAHGLHESTDRQIDVDQRKDGVAAG